MLGGTIMAEYTFNYMDKSYSLGERNLTALVNDLERPVKGFDVKEVIELLNNYSEVDFEKAYYEEPCEECKAGVKEKVKYFDFLEFHFYIFTKDENYVVSDISNEYENTSFNRLLREGKVDDSYIVSVIVCEGCGSYSIEIEQCPV